MTKLLAVRLSSVTEHLQLWVIEQEIYKQIFPHLRAAKTHNYEFKDIVELSALCSDQRLRAEALLASMETKLALAGGAYGYALSFIIHRNLNRRLITYSKLVQLGAKPA